jgi:hypothetical protein
VFESQP